MPRAKKDSDVLTVRLLRDHTHGGLYLPEGARIDVSRKKARWLAVRGIVSPSEAEGSVRGELALPEFDERKEDAREDAPE